MRAARMIGLETEYGIHAPANPKASHVALSIELVNAYAAHATESGSAVAGTEWDYQSESPLVDARGWVLPRSAAHPTQLTDTDEALNYATEQEAGSGQVRDALGNISGGDPSPADTAERGEHDPPGSAHWRGDFFQLQQGQPQLLMNLVLTNGARFYVDHAHPEYSAPETLGAKQAALYDAAGDVVALRAANRLAKEPGSPQVLLYKNNTDSKSVSYGAHENYLVPREVPFDDLVHGLLPFFVSRQVICGAGKVGIGQRNQTPGFQISQRADFFEEEVGLETTVRRPIINTRDEPHAHFRSWRRLHVIIGDANMSQYSTWMRVASTSHVLDLIEAGRVPAIRLHDPVEALKSISHDPSLSVQVSTDRGPMTALEIQRLYLDAAQELHAEKQNQHDAAYAASAEELEAWHGLLDDLQTDPFTTADRVDWVAKLQLLESYRRRDQLDWDAPLLGMIDLQYHDLRPEKGLHHKLVRAGRMRALFAEEQVTQAADQPPADTRAWTRGTLVGKRSDLVVGASWDQMLLRPDAVSAVVRVSLADPLAGRQEQAEPIIEAAESAHQLVDQLAQLFGERSTGH